MATVSSERIKLVSLLEWVSKHPCVMDVDGASERVLSALEGLSADTGSQEISTIVDLLNELVDTVGNCETEERHLKTQLWFEIVARADEARALLNA